MVMRRAAAFCTRCNGLIVDSGRPASAALQYIVESAEYKCSDQTLGDFFASGTTDLTQSPQLEEAAADNSIYVLLHRQLSIKVDTKIPYDRDRLDDVITN